MTRNVVDAACLAHDLGHPPFGHTAEAELKQLADERGILDSFEGNAQSFRVVTKLALRRDKFPGLNLTRATLNALLKYPWPREAGKHEEKWGVYSDEREVFDWARQGQVKDRKTAEAEIMDYADDIAYSVHDMEDFYVAGRIPLRMLVVDSNEQDRFLEGARKRWNATDEQMAQARKALDRLLDLLSGLANEPYTGTRKQRSVLRTITGVLVNRCVNAIELSPAESGPLVSIGENERAEIKVLKEFTWFYVINDPALATQQHGQRKMIRDLFEICEGAISKDPKPKTASRLILPQRILDELDEIEKSDAHRNEKARDRARARLLIDLIAGMSELQVIHMHHRLTGVALGSSMECVF